MGTSNLIEWMNELKKDVRLDGQAPFVSGSPSGLKKRQRELPPKRIGQRQELCEAPNVMLRLTGRPAHTLDAVR